MRPAPRLDLSRLLARALLATEAGRPVCEQVAAVGPILALASHDRDLVQGDGEAVMGFSGQRDLYLAGPACLTLECSGRAK